MSEVSKVRGEAPHIEYIYSCSQFDYGWWKISLKLKSGRTITASHANKETCIRIWNTLVKTLEEDYE